MYIYIYIIDKIVIHEYNIHKYQLFTNLYLLCVFYILELR